jgi:hypothetical protein
MRELELTAELLSNSLPYLRKRAMYNPEPGLVELIKSIETYLELRNHAVHHTGQM